MKKTQLKIADLKVQSFVTSVEEQKSETVKGGSGGPVVTNGGGQAQICTNTIIPDQSICNPACITNFAPLCF